MGDLTRDAEQVFAIREFNRFYTARLGLLRKKYLDGEFSLTEARILYEIDLSSEPTASTIGEIVRLDAGYISRILTHLTKRKLILQTPSELDGRKKILALSKTGQNRLAELNEQSAQQIRGLLHPLSESERNLVIASLSRVRSILSRKMQPAARIVRLTQANDDALRLLQEYYESIQVLNRDAPKVVRKIIGAASSGMWLAYFENKAVGCVVLRKLDSLSFAGECKRLYVQPWARGHGIANALLDAQEQYACSEGLRWIYLDSRDDLKAAIALYQKRGYVPCEQYNENTEATIFLRKRIDSCHARLPNRQARALETLKGGK